MTYKEAYNFFFKRLDFEKRKKISYNSQNFSLKKSRELLQELNNPEKKLKIIHIAGTNGKGSTAFYLEQFLLASNKTTGTFISPHIERMNERIRFNGRDITDNELILLAKEVKTRIKAKNDYTSFELLFGAALFFFVQNEANYVILETGVGGKLDSTNVITPIATVITKIDFDHQDLLGDTILKIAQEKAGIIKNGIPCILHKQERQVEKIIQNECSQKTSPLHYNLNSHICEFEDIIPALMPGKFQKDNFLSAATTYSLLNLKLDRKKLYRNLTNNYLPGRIEIIDTAEFKIILDGGHNVSALQALSNFIQPFNKKVVTIVAMMSNKDIKKNMAIIKQFTDSLIITQMDSKRSATTKELKTEDFTDYHSTNSIEAALKLALKIINKNDILVVTGSFYLVGAIKKIGIF